jgi:hypothetical protein
MTSKVTIKEKKNHTKCILSPIQCKYFPENKNKNGNSSHLSCCGVILLVCIWYCGIFFFIIWKSKY